MGYQDAMNAINLIMPSRIPRTEYSASFHLPLVRRVTGLEVNEHSSGEEQHKASLAFEKAWDFGFAWNVLIHASALTGPKTYMGHAVYQAGGVDYNNEIIQPFKTAEDVLKFDPFAAYGERDIDQLVRDFDAHYEANCLARPDQVNMTGIYITMISGLLEVFGWTMLLEGLAEDADEFGAVANRYGDWILQYFEALAR